jgi:hypothetical protein
MPDHDLFGNAVVATDAPPRVVDGVARNRDGSYRSNPLVRAYGAGPEGKRCKGCAHLTQKRRWFKCDLRAGTFEKSSPVSDHRANWWACGKFQPIPSET